MSFDEASNKAPEEEGFLEDVPPTPDDGGEPPPLSPANRWLLDMFCRSESDRKETLNAFNVEMASPGVYRNRLRGRNAVVFVFMVGIVRQPAIFLFGPIIAPFAYAFVVYSFLK